MHVIAALISISESAINKFCSVRIVAARCRLYLLVSNIYNVIKKIITRSRPPKYYFVTKQSYILVRR